MGVCASAPKDHGSAVRIDFSAVRTTTVDAPEGVSVSSFDLPRYDGDVFFDSRAWLDSDCEDFFSVYDETTPPGTPIHHSICIDRTPDFIPKIPSAEPKKLLIELLRESNDSDPVVIDRALQHTPTSPGPVDSPTITDNRANNYVWRSEMSPNLKPLKSRSSQSSSCCLPNLALNLSFNERRKRLSNGNYSPSPAAPGTTGKLKQISVEVYRRIKSRYSASHQL